MNDNKRKVAQVLSDPDYAGRRATGALSALFLTILSDIRMTVQKWDRLMNRYLDDPALGLPPTGKVRSTARGNLNKALMSDPMTFKSFLRGMKFVEADEVRFEVHITRKGRKTVHGVDLDMSVAQDVFEPDKEE